MKLKKILVATDFSTAADYALKRAVKLAKEQDAELTIIHVIQQKFVDKILDKLIPKEILQTALEHATTLIEHKIANLSRYKVNINYHLTTHGKPATKILAYAHKNKFDLIVLGAHGAYSLRESFIGSTAEWIAERSVQPLLIVRNPPTSAYRKILVPLDFSSVSKKVLNVVTHFFKNTNIRFIHIGDFEFQEMLQREIVKDEISKAKLLKLRKAILSYLNKDMKRFIKGYTSQLKNYTYQITLGYPGPIIKMEADKTKRDLIVMGTQSHGPMHYLFIGRVANWVLKESDKDILLIPPKALK